MLTHKNCTEHAPGIIVATSRTSGQGLTLHRAAHLILMEVDWVSARHTQAWGRVCRIGQKSPKVFCYVFSNNQAEEEQRAIHANYSRQALENTVNNYGQKSSQKRQPEEEDNSHLFA